MNKKLVIGIGVAVPLILLLILFFGKNRSDGEKIKTDIPVQTIYENVKAAYGEDYLPSQLYDETMIKDLFGVSPEWYTEAIAEGPMISFHVDTFIAVKADAEDGKKKVKEALSAYRDNLIENSFQYPANQAKVQASQVVDYGPYVFFIMLGAIPMETQDQGEEQALAAYQARNEVGVSAIETLLYGK